MKLWSVMGLILLLGLSSGALGGEFHMARCDGYFAASGEIVEISAQSSISLQAQPNEEGVVLASILVLDDLTEIRVQQGVDSKKDTLRVFRVHYSTKGGKKWALDSSSAAGNGNDPVYLFAMRKGEETDVRCTFVK